MQTVSFVKRVRSLFYDDLENSRELIDSVVSSSRFLVVGGAGTIGQSVVREIFRRSPATLHVVDISENNLVELVRDLRSSMGYISGEFRTFALDCGSCIFKEFLRENQPYDYILNLSAMKHVRSERDKYTLLRLLETNILYPLNILDATKHVSKTKHFCVSSDKAANPANMMGASKRIMEMSMWAETSLNTTSMARFANVEFSDGSLPFGFANRIAKHQPITAPTDVKRYFITKQEAGELCLLAAILGNDKEIFVPKHAGTLTLESFSDIAINYLRICGLQPVICSTEEEARAIHKFDLTKEWPCYFFESDTTGEKSYEEFYTTDEALDFDRFENLAVIKYQPSVSTNQILKFHTQLNEFLNKGSWTKEDLVGEVMGLVPGFKHYELNKSLDEKM